MKGYPFNLRSPFSIYLFANDGRNLQKRFKDIRRQLRKKFYHFLLQLHRRSKTTISDFLFEHLKEDKIARSKPELNCSSSDPTKVNRPGEEKEEHPLIFAVP